jgi:membrane associated rhomboid family serine protease
MNIIYHIANTLVLPPAMFFAYNFYKFRGREINYRKLWISISIISLTFIVTSLQFIFPEIITALGRNKDALLSGEVWRLISPLFIQPMGIWQCLFNGVFFVAFLPIAEYFYGRSIMLIYFGAGLTGQIVNYYWNAGGRGGSSTALYGVMGSLFMYILLNRKAFPRGYFLIPMAGFLGATVLCFFKDGHAPSLLMGGILSLVLHRNSRVISSPQKPSGTTT